MSSRDYAEFQAHFQHAPFGQHALVQQIALFVLKILQALGDHETTLEDLIWSPFEVQQRNRSVEDLDDDELEEVEAQQAEDLDDYESDVKARKGTIAEELAFIRRAEAEEL